jgi:hypothetical protein
VAQLSRLDFHHAGFTRSYFKEHEMGWGIGFDSNWNRDIGYGAPAICDHPLCNEKIDRGLAHVCGEELCGVDRGCGLFFCELHLHYHAKLPRLCECCAPRLEKPFIPKPDIEEWISWKLTDESWAQWREENPEEVAKLKGNYHG